MNSETFERTGMKIAHIVWGFENGGTENMLADIIYYQSTSNNRISLHVINDLVNPNILQRVPKNVCVHLYKRKLGSKSPFAFFKLNFTLFREKPDIIHLHMPQMKKWIWVKSNFVRTIHSCMSDDTDYSRMKLLIAISDSVRDYTKKQNPKYQVDTIYNGIDVCKILTKEIYRVKGAVLNILQVSRLQHRVKGQDLVIEAISKIQKGNPTIDITYTIIGGGESEQYLNKLIIEKCLEGRVKLLGNKSRDYIYNHLRDYDLFILPSRNEGFGLTIAEAMSAKVPVLTSDQEGPLEVIKGGELADVFVTGDVDSLINKLLLIYNSDSNIDRVEKACKYVHERFSVKVTAEKYVDAYHKVL